MAAERPFIATGQSEKVEALANLLTVIAADASGEQGADSGVNGCLALGVGGNDEIAWPRPIDPAIDAPEHLAYQPEGVNADIDVIEELDAGLIVLPFLKRVVFAVQRCQRTAVGDVAAGERQCQVAGLCQYEDVLEPIDVELMTLRGWHTRHG